MKVHHYSYWWTPESEAEHPDNDACPIYEGAEEKSIQDFEKHIEIHRCTEPGIPEGSPGGFAHCDEAMNLFRAMPEAEQVVIG